MNNHQTQNPSSQADLSRRNFLKQSSVAVAGVAAVSFPSILHAQTKPPINAVVIGIGGRGGGAARDFTQAVQATGVEGKIVAVADMYPQQALRGNKSFGVPEDKCFSGFDAYVKALAIPGVNYAIIATPPGFRPGIFKACIESGKNVFMEKPVATDGAGCRIMYATGELAKQKGLKVAAGTQRRHQAGYIDTIKRLQDGAIGDIVFLRAYWVNGGPIWHQTNDRPRYGQQVGPTDIEKQINNWYHYIWLSGDHICEQHIHNLDVCNWVMNDHPIKCWGQGSRQQLGDKAGEIWDNFDVEYQYANGARMYSYCGQISRKWSSISEAVHGTKGVSDPGGNYKTKDGTQWRTQAKNNPSIQEHVDLINAIVNGTELNETKNVTNSTLTAIMGREAAYSGYEVDWDTVLNAKFTYGPDLLYTDPSKLTWGPFRTLKPPMPSFFNSIKDPPLVPTV